MEAGGDPEKIKAINKRIDQVLARGNKLMKDL